MSVISSHLETNDAFKSFTVICLTHSFTQCYAVLCYMHAWLQPIQYNSSICAQIPELLLCSELCCIVHLKLKCKVLQEKKKKMFPWQRNTEPGLGSNRE